MTRRLVFGVDSMPDAVEKKKRESPNPCVDEYGPGPQGATCGECIHLIGVQYSKTYYKCEEWRLSHSAATDFRRKWPACSRFEKLASENLRRRYDADAR